jgi:hypothetical protein
LGIQVGKNPEHHGCMKHLDLRFFWLRDEVEKQHLALGYIPTAAMAADLLTKPLGHLKVQTAQEAWDLLLMFNLNDAASQDLEGVLSVAYMLLLSRFLFF